MTMALTLKGIDNFIKEKTFYKMGGSLLALPMNLLIVKAKLGSHVFPKNDHKFDRN